MSAKEKGCNAERELIHAFWSVGWTACRVAGSGSMKYPAPDIIANKEGICLAIECKACGNKYQYLEKREVEELIAFAKMSGARPLIAVRFFRKDWCFLNPEDLKDSGASLVVTPDLAGLKGCSFVELTKSL